MEEKKEIQLDNVMAYEAGKRDAIAEVLEFASRWCAEMPVMNVSTKTQTKGNCYLANTLRDALLQKFGGKG